MLTVTLKPDLAEQITDLAGSNNLKSIEAFIDQVLRTHLSSEVGYLTRIPNQARLTHSSTTISRESKIRAEREAFERQYTALLADYANQYVALHHGQVIDHDPNLRTLHLRVFTKLGHTTVLLKKVTKEPERELVFRSPRFERGKT